VYIALIVIVKYNERYRTSSKANFAKRLLLNLIKKLATWGTQDEDKQNKTTTQYVMDTTIHKQTQIT
jgi:hypothetical protein